MGVHDFGLRPDDFWGLTLREYLKLWERYSAEQDNRDYRAALIAASIYNTVPRKDRKVFTPDDFLAKKQQKSKQKAHQAKQQNMRETVEYLNKVFRGRDLREVSK